MGMKKGIASNKIYSIGLPLIILIGIFFAGHGVYAGTSWATDVLTGLIGIIISALGLILILVMKGLLLIANYQHFIDPEGIVNGWKIVRDICNMFFVLILMLIAFGTILNLPEYSYKKWLPKLILMAILINFSKTICGLLIDFAQVVMLTFVNAFKDVAGANLINILGVKDIVTLAESSEKVSDWEVIGAYVLGLIYLVIAIIVIVAMMAMLAMRLVMIWIYVVLSPLAYLLSAFPGGSKYSGQWWSEFTKNLIVGPVLAFFIWLSFATLQTGSVTFDSEQADKEAEGEVTATLSAKSTASSSNAAVASTEASKPSSLIKFVIAIGMLLGGMKIAQEIGGQAGSLAGKVASKGKKLAVGATVGVGLKTGKGLVTGDNYFARKFAKATGWDFRPVKMVESVKASFAKSKKDDERDIREKSKKHFEAGGFRSVALGMGVGQDYFDRHIDGFLGYKGIKRAAKETFYNPRKRKSIGGEIDSVESKLEDLETKKASLVEGKKQEIEAKASQDISQDSTLADLKSQRFQNTMDLSALKSKQNRTKDDDAAIKKLEDKGDSLDKQISGRENDIREKSKKEFLESDSDVVSLETDININKESLKKLKDEIMKFQKPMAFEARTLYRKDVEEAKSKYKSITNSDELQKALTDAQERGNKFDQIAILEKLSNDANLNEEMKSKGYDSNAKGLYSYIFNKENIDGEKKGLSGRFSQAERIQILNDLGETEERVGHWDMAKMAGVNSKGDMESLVKEKKDANGNTYLDDTEHATHAYAEVIKMDPQKIVNSLNRLAFGGEDGHGQFQISNLGKMIFKYLASSEAYEKNPGRILGNTAANLCSPNVVPTLEKLMENDMQKFNKVISILKERSQTKETSFKPGDMIGWLRNKGFDK